MTDSTGAEPSDTGRRLFTRETLACGADVDELLEQVADGHGEQLTAHQSRCVHCQAAIREFTDLWSPVRDLAATPVPTPAEFTAAIMDRVRSVVQDVWYTLQLTDDGPIRIAARIVATLARDTARRVPGVHVALGRSTHGKLADIVEKATLLHRHPHAAVGVLGRTAVVDLAVAVTYGDPVHDIARRIQRDVITELGANVGLKTVTVNVTIDDVVAPRSAADRPA